MLIWKCRNVLQVIWNKHLSYVFQKCNAYSTFHYANRILQNKHTFYLRSIFNKSCYNITHYINAKVQGVSINMQGHIYWNNSVSVLRRQVANLSWKVRLKATDVYYTVKNSMFTQRVLLISHQFSLLMF